MKIEETKIDAELYEIFDKETVTPKEYSTWENM
jgi:hypothetical protein